MIPAGGAGRVGDRTGSKSSRSALGARRRSIVYLAGDRGYTTIFKTGIDGGKVSRFSLFVLDGQLAGGFDPQRSRNSPPGAVSNHELQF